jgi:serine/threonine protein kinase/class 3 adenylate cyclase
MKTSAHPEPQLVPKPPPEQRLVVLLFTDLINSSGLKVKWGDVAYATQIARPHNDLFRRLLADYAGAREISYTGDGFLASFLSVGDAVQVALRFHDGLRRMPWECEPVQTRIGIHVGQSVILNDDGAEGLTIASHAADMCARLMSLGDGGQTLLTRHAFDDARQYVREHPEVAPGEAKPALAWAAHGPYLFKGKEEPIEVFEVGAQDIAPLTAPPDAEKAKRALRPGEVETLGWRPAPGVIIPGRAEWQLSEKLGEGGFGEVWLAEHRKLKELRVFKFCFDEERLRSFKRELTFFRLIRDALGEREDIARLYDLKLDAPPFFLESEFARHGNLLQWFERQGGLAQMPLPQRLEMVATIAEAVAAAHSVGILHKDIKPQNILIQSSRGGGVHPQLTDFGISALADTSVLQDHDITAMGFTVKSILVKNDSSGLTRLYAPPELLVGKPFTVQGDIYSLGILLYQMVVGDFTRALAAGWERDVADPLLQQDIAECVDGEPHRRFASPLLLAERLRNLSQRRQHIAEQNRREAQLLRKRRLVRIGLAGGFGALVIASALAVAVFRERDLRQAADDSRELAAARLVHALQARDAAESLISTANTDLREQLMPLEKISVLEGLTKASEEYFAKLPHELVTNRTRAHEVQLGLNRALVSGAKSEDAEQEAAVVRTLKLAADLSLSEPENETHWESQYFCIFSLAVLRMYQERVDESLEYAQQMAALAVRWKQSFPKSSQPLRAELAAIALPLVARRNKDMSMTEAAPIFQKTQDIAAQIRALGGETLETKFAEAGAIMAKAVMFSKMRQHALAKSSHQEAAIKFQEALGLAKGNPLAKELVLGSRRFLLNSLKSMGEQENNEPLLQEVARQARDVVQQLQLMASAEPMRLERWRMLAWFYVDHGKLIRRFDGPQAARDWYEAGLKAADLAHRPTNSRPSVNIVRASVRLGLVDLLKTDFPQDSLDRSVELLRETWDLRYRILEGKERAFHPERDQIASLIEPIRIWVKIWDALPAAAENWARFEKDYREIRQRLERLCTQFPHSSSARRMARDIADALIPIAQRWNQSAGLADLKQWRESHQQALDNDFRHDPVESYQRLKDAVQAAYNELNNHVRKLEESKRAEAAAPVIAKLQATLSEILEKEALYTPEDFAHLRGYTHAILGAAHFDASQYAEAETQCRDAQIWRTRAATLTDDPYAKAARTFDAADSATRHALAVSRQTERREEGLQLSEAALQAIENATRNWPMPHRFKDTAAAWRRHFSMLGGDKSSDAHLASVQKSLELLKEADRLINAENIKRHDEIANIRQDIIWTSIDLADVYRKRNDLASAITQLEYAVSLAMTFWAPLSHEQQASRVWSLISLHHALSWRYLEHELPEKAAPHFQTVKTYFQKFKNHPNFNAGNQRTVENWLQELEKRFPPVVAP